ncbi:MAG: nucleotide exchange factor GrpE [Clostridiales bacterium]|jgi:molecular chaperone GrpE|nr:nucleotide exchange factor GrpE [Clostridiales bacterium]
MEQNKNNNNHNNNSSKDPIKVVHNKSTNSQYNNPVPKANNDPKLQAKSESKDIDESIKGLEQEIVKLKEQHQKDLEDAKTILQAMQAANQKDKQRIEELTTSLERIQADFKNYKKRTEDQMASVVIQGKAEAVISMIPVLDVVYNAIDMIQDKSVKDGVVMIAKKMESVLADMGIQELDCLQQDFDPELHNAIMRVETHDDAYDGKVVHVFQKGYKLGDKIVRHAQVKVGYKA